ncbi:type III secretion system chaperone [Vibrio sp. 10N.261.51.C5]|uniref:type III secretion system chaperone n=1 Tax=Vibrio sp. 10N.261.51.C5 TaxID=3229675 RepID=UPI00354DEC27
MDKVNTLLIELGNTLDIEQVTAYDYQMWTVYMSAGKEIEVQGLDEREELLLSIKVCQDEESFEIKKLKTLLEYNFLYRESGGVQFCIDPKNNEVHMQISIPLTSEVSRVSILITQLMELCELWKQYLTAQFQSIEQHKKLHTFISV